MLTDPIADFLTKIRNAVAGRKDTVEAPYSTLKHEIATLMVKRGFLSEIRIKEEGGKKTIVAFPNSELGAISVRRVSKPGQRIYVGYKTVKRVKNGLGLGIYSTSKGIISDSEARKQKIGGEYVCEIY